jgi:hypothetical protein
MRALPIASEIRKLSRHYLGNVIYSYLGNEFQAFISERVEARNKKQTEKQNLMIEMDPEIARIFRESTAVPRKYYTSPCM